MATQNVTTQIISHLTAKSLLPTQEWLANFLNVQNLTLPTAAIKQTALFRLLASDIKTSLQSTTASTFPQDVLDAEIQERRLIGPIPVQVLDIEDISRSQWSQIEDIEAVERGETTQGREVIRVLPREQGTSEPEPVVKGGMHKLLLQDAKGVSVYGFEVAAVDGISLNMSIGTKMIFKNILVARGVLLLEPGSTTIVGGKIESLHKTWKEGRKDALKASVGSSAAS